MNDRTTLLRQVNPGFMREGKPSSQVFRPTSDHHFRLSVDNGDLTDARSSWTHFTAELKLSSIGVLGITVAECSEQDLPCKPDPMPGNRAHALIDFSGLNDTTIRRKGKVLLNHALIRDWLYRP